jgi:methylated-DNA-[protein]-cysteine S-methyltransferase
MTPTEPADHRGNHSDPHEPDILDDLEDTEQDTEPDDVDDDTFEAEHDDLVRRLAAGRPLADGGSASEPDHRDVAEGQGGLADLLAAVGRRAETDELLDVAWTTTDSPVGPLTLAATPAGLVRVAFGTDDGIFDELAQKISPRVLEAPARLDDVRRQLDEYFVGDRHRFDLPLDWGLSRGFREAALRKLVEVPYGQVVSYKELATRAGSPNAVRATGTAMATNPIPLVVPCHRVVRSGGELGRYGGGVEAKVWLLQLEGAPALRRR